jgi:hypothetical protein
MQDATTIDETGDVAYRFNEDDLGIAAPVHHALDPSDSTPDRPTQQIESSGGAPRPGTGDVRHQGRSDEPQAYGGVTWGISTRLLPCRRRPRRTTSPAVAMRR